MSDPYLYGRCPLVWHCMLPPLVVGKALDQTCSLASFLSGDLELLWRRAPGPHRNWKNRNCQGGRGHDTLSIVFSIFQSAEDISSILSIVAFKPIRAKFTSSMELGIAWPPTWLELARVGLNLIKLKSSPNSSQVFHRLATSANSSLL